MHPRQILTDVIFAIGCSDFVDRSDHALVGVGVIKASFKYPLVIMPRQMKPDRRLISPSRRQRESLRNYRIPKNQANILNRFIAEMEKTKRQKETQHRRNNAVNKKLQSMQKASLMAGVPPDLLIKFTPDNAKYLMR